MKLTLIPSSTSAHGPSPHQYAISYLIDDEVAVDAGCLGFHGSPEDQARVKHLFLSHTHADHVASLPIFVENAFDGRPDPVTIHASPAALDGLRRDVFNGRTWPDFIAMSETMGPFLKIHEIESEGPVELPGMTVTPVAVDHLVPTLGFILDDGKSSVVIASDTGPTGRLWEISRGLANLKAVFLEAAFPNALLGLAVASKHLTPALFAEEARKLGRDDVPLVVVHIKARFRAQILRELDDLALPNLVIGQFDEPYEF